jgi:Protein of unknown function (DUF4012)
VVLGVLAVLALLGGWLAVSGLRARADLTRARAALTDARTAAVDQRLGVAAAALARAQGATSGAKGLTSDPVWWAARHVPYLGRTPQAVSTAAAQADRLTHDVLPTLLLAADHASPARLRTSGDTINLAPLVSAAPALAAASSAVTDVQARLAQARARRGVFAPVRRALDQLTASVDDLAATLHGASLAAGLLPPMLGADGPRRYLLAFQNPSESRGTGGLVGGYGVLEADHGHLQVTALGTDSDLKSLTRVPAELGADYVALWGQDPALWVNSNESANFPDGARIWLAAWQAQHGERLDGVLALDPEVLSYLLAVTGPATLPSGERVSAADVVASTMQVAYVRFAADPTERKTYLTEVSGAVVKQLFASAGDPVALVRALGRGVAERRVLVYSDHPDEESQLAPEPLSGSIPAGPGPSLLMAVNNAAGSKLDYYLDRALVYRGTACRVGVVRATEVDLTLTNTVDPAAHLPDYVVGVLGGQASSPARRNDDKVTAGFWLSPGAEVQGVTVDGLVAKINVGTELGHPVVLTTLTLPARQPVRVVVRLSEPATRAAARITVQPLVRPQRTSVDVPVCN